MRRNRTIWTCDACGHTEECEHGNQPDGWSRLTMTKHPLGGEADVDLHVHVCGPCGGSVREHLRRPGDRAMSGRTVRDAIATDVRGLTAALGLDPNTPFDRETQRCVVVPKCETCGGSGAIANPDDWREVLRLGGPGCLDCGGRGWRMP